jgi:hypothetical protein
MRNPILNQQGVPHLRVGFAFAASVFSTTVGQYDALRKKQG